MTKLILIRHGETSINATGKTHLANDSTSLNSEGIKQIKKTAKRLKELNIDKIYSSTEQRAIESARLLAKVTGLSTEAVSGLQERNWGEYEGRPWGEIKDILDTLSFDERYEFTPPEGESWKEFETRLIDAISSLINTEQDETIAVVSHGGAIRALIPALLDIPRQESFRYDPDNASMTIFEVDGDSFNLVVANDTSYL